MAVVEVHLCDMCLADGNSTVAVARYWNCLDEEYHACAKHLRFVTELGLEYERLTVDE